MKNNWYRDTLMLYTIPDKTGKNKKILNFQVSESSYLQKTAGWREGVNLQSSMLSKVPKEKLSMGVSFLSRNH